MIGQTPADERFMEAALAEAREAAKEGEVPVGAVIVWDGRIIGGWAHRKDGEIAVRLLEDAGAEAAAAIAAEAQRLRDWIGADERHAKTLITPRFRTPLERELAG